MQALGKKAVLAGVAATAAFLMARRTSSVSLGAWLVTNVALPIVYRDGPTDRQSLLAAIGKDRAHGPALPPRRMRDALNFTDSVGPAGRRFTLDAGQGSSRGPHILYFHGGAYVMQLVAPQWTLIGGLVERIGGTVTVPLYPLAPEHDGQAGLAMADAAFDELAERVGAPSIVVAGDSAGGGLALALTQRRRAAGKSLPAGLVLFCPWLDATVSGTDQPDIERRDPTLTIAMLRAAGRMWAGAEDPASPPFSPLFGDHSGLPPTLVFAGTRDLLSSDARRFAAMAPAVTLELYTDMFHVWMAAPIAEGRRALDRAAAFVAAAVSSPVREATA